MTPENRPATTTSSAPPSQIRSANGAGSPPPNRPELAALSEASRRFGDKHRGAGDTARKSMHVIIAITSAISVGVALTMAEKFEYECGAIIEVTGDGASRQLATVQEALAGFVSRGAATEASTTSNAIIVEGIGPASLRLYTRTADRDGGTATARRTADAFLAEFAGSQQRCRSTPSEAERMLGAYAAELDKAFSTAEADLAGHLSSIPSRDPTGDRHAGLQAWNTLRDKFLGQRSSLATAAATLAALEAMPEPTHGIVPLDDRRNALAANRTLQQDLRELLVQLTELKLHLLTVWQKSGSPLEQLAAAAADFTELVKQQDLSSLLPEATPSLTLETAATQYAEALGSFQKSWTTTFATAKRLDVDPLAGDLLDAHQRSRVMLNGFLFEASKWLTSIRSDIRRLDQGAVDHARFHVLYSNLKRSFGSLQKAHHDFEFTAGRIDPRDNFRLETSLRSSRGLRRRSQQQIGIIDAQLQAKAVERAQAEQLAALTNSKKQFAQQQRDLDQTFVYILDTQRSLNENATLTEAFLRGQVEAEIGKAKMRNTSDALIATRNQIDALSMQRIDDLGDVTLEIVECGVLRGPINLRHRLRIGGLAALITLMTVGFVQWMFTRRR